MVVGRETEITNISRDAAMHDETINLTSIKYLPVDGGKVGSKTGPNWESKKAEKPSLEKSAYVLHACPLTSTTHTLWHPCFHPEFDPVGEIVGI